MWLAFPSPSAEEAFVGRRNRQLVGQDVSWALFWTFMVGGGVAKWARAEGSIEHSELAYLLPYFMCCPALLAAIRLWPQWYVRHRVAAITALRLARTLLFMACIHRWESIYLGSPMTAIPTTPFAIFEHLSWKPCSHIVAGLGFVTPLRAFLPFQLLFLLLNLRAAGQRCLAECAAGTSFAAISTTAAAGCSAAAGSSTAATATATAAAAAQAGLLKQVCHQADPAVALAYYQRVVVWIRRAVPIARFLPPNWRLGKGGCLPTCYAAHAWLQAAPGVLATLALLWGWEERLRCREVKAWRLRLQQQREEQEAAAAAASLAGSSNATPATTTTATTSPGIAGTSAQPSRSFLRASMREPMPGLALAAGWVAASWALWLLLEAMLLQLDFAAAAAAVA